MSIELVRIDCGSIKAEISATGHQRVVSYLTEGA
jgi:hypothetical protein